MFCKFCGQTLDATAVKCSRCGRNVPAQSDCGGFYQIMPGMAPKAAEPARSAAPAEYAPVERPRKKQLPLISLILAALLVVALVMLAVQGSRIASLEDQLTDLKKDVSELSDELESYQQAGSEKTPDESGSAVADPGTTDPEDAATDMPGLQETLPATDPADATTAAPAPDETEPDVMDPDVMEPDVMDPEETEPAVQEPEEGIAAESEATDPYI